MIRTVVRTSQEGKIILVEQDLLTVREVAVALRVDQSTIRRWIKEGSLEAIILPGSGRHRKYRIRKSTLDQIVGKAG